jgi:hypothetical protein
MKAKRMKGRWSSTTPAKSSTDFQAVSYRQSQRNKINLEASLPMGVFLPQILPAVSPCFYRLFVG